MVDRRVLSRSGTVLQETEIAELSRSLEGALVRPGEQDYDKARKVWNGMVDRYPALIARCAGDTGVIKAVNFARANDLLVAVRGGGHNVAGNAVCDGGLVIDLSRMTSIRVDPPRRIAHAQGGATWGAFDRQTQAHGLATTGGFVSTTGIAGLTLGGGLGWLMGKYGLACDNLLSVDLITADGRMLRVNETEHPDLFWGVRGGGGNFGVVTAFEFRLHQLGKVLGGLVLYPLAKTRDVLRFYREFIAKAPDEMTTVAAAVTGPDGVPLAAVGVCHIGPLPEAERAVGRLTQFGPPVAVLVRPIDYCELQTTFDAANPPGLLTYWKSSFLRELSNAAIDTFAEHCARLPSPMTQVLIEDLHGAVNRVGKDETAFANRDAHFNFTIVSIWKDPDATEANVRWTREFWKAMQPFASGGVYVNYLGQESDEGRERVMSAYGPNYQRLLALKKRYDPTNFFRLNQNIPPSP